MRNILIFDGFRIISVKNYVAFTLQIIFHVIFCASLYWSSVEEKNKLTGVHRSQFITHESKLNKLIKYLADLDLARRTADSW